MTRLKNYRFGFDFWGLALFVVIMVPNFIWFMKPAPDDILRADSVTGTIDAVASVCQVLLVAFMCLFVNKKTSRVRLSLLVIMVILSVVFYFCGWVLYYLGNTGPLVILLLTLFPCMAFVFYLLDRKNLIALIPAVLFACCHLIYGLANFIL